MQISDTLIEDIRKWQAAKRELGEREDNGEPIDSDYFAALDDDASEIVSAIADEIEDLDQRSAERPPFDP